MNGKYQEEHSSINRVMLAMCLLSGGGDPSGIGGGGALKRRPTDPLILL